MRKISLVLIIFSNLILAENIKFYNPSFDCSKVKEESVKYSICTNKKLAMLDRELTNTYGQIINNKFVNKKKLTDEQNQWLKIRNKLTNNKDIINLYYERSEFFNFIKYQLTLVHKNLFPRNGYSRFAKLDRVKHKIVKTCVLPRRTLVGYYVDENYYVKYDYIGSSKQIFLVKEFFDNDEKAVGYLDSFIGDSTELTGTPIYIYTRGWYCSNDDKKIIDVIEGKIR